MEIERIPHNWPPEFVMRMQGWLGGDAGAFFEALAKRDYGLRLNPQRGTLESLGARLPWETQPVPWCPEGRWLSEEADIGTHVYHTTGVYYIQDPSAMAAAVLLDPQPGEWILDLAAAPGGKASHIAARMRHEGVLVANDTVRRRVSVLARNLERMGITHTMIINESPEHLAERWAGLFDAVLVDAPCSGEATFSRDVQSLRDWSLTAVQNNAHHQRGILEQAASLVRRGGRILYGTCTFSPEEDEGIIAAFLAHHPDFVLSDLPSLPGLQPGRPEWLPGGLSSEEIETLRRCGRFWPHTGPGHGHFYALLQRQGEPPNDLPEVWKGSTAPKRIMKLYQKRAASVLRTPPSEHGLILTESDDLYVTPIAPSLWEGLRVMRPGWWVASLRHNKINLDHALAMTLRRDDVVTCIDVSPDDPRLALYLRGSSWPEEGPAGLVLVMVDGFPLGWAKRDGKSARSRYPIHLRR